MQSCNSKTFPVDTRVLSVRTISRSVDPYAGLKGLDYINARNLNPLVQRVQTSAHTAPPSTAEACQ